jgi:hypothetical protein
MKDEFEMAIEMERATLLPDRYYMVVRPTGEETFAVTLYDTTEGKLDEEGYPHPAEIVMQGLLAMLNTDVENVFAYGAAAVEFDKFKRTATEEAGLSFEAGDDNIIRVNFGPKQ